MQCMRAYLQEEAILCVLRDVIRRVAGLVGDERVDVEGGSMDKYRPGVDKSHALGCP